MRMLREDSRVVFGLVDFGLGTNSLRADGPAPLARGRVVKGPECDRMLKLKVARSS